MAELATGTRLGGDATELTRGVSRVISCALSENQHRGSCPSTVGLGWEYFRCTLCLPLRLAQVRLLLDMCACSVGDLGELRECLFTVAIDFARPGH